MRILSRHLKHYLMKRDEILKLANKAKAEGKMTPELARKFRSMIVQAHKDKPKAKVEVKEQGAKALVVDFRQVSNGLKEMKRAQDEMREEIRGGVKISNLDEIKESKGERLLEANIETTGLLREDIQGLKEQSQKQADTLAQVLVGMFQVMSEFFTKLITQAVIKVRPTADSFLTPQYMVMFDPETKTIVRPRDLFGKHNITVSAGGVKAVKLKDASGAVIDPATESTLEAVETALGVTNGLLVDIAAALGSIGGGATTMGSGRKVVAVTNTAVALSTSQACKTVFITALIGNTNPVVVGGSGVIYTEAVRTGKLMYPGDSITISIANLEDIFINGEANDGVSYAYTN